MILFNYLVMNLIEQTTQIKIINIEINSIYNQQLYIVRK